MITYTSLIGKRKKRASSATFSSGKWRTRDSKCWFWNDHSSDYFRAVIIIVGLFATGMYLGVFDTTLGYPGEGPRPNWQNKWHEAIRAKICSAGGYLSGFIATKWDTQCIEGALKSALNVHSLAKGGKGMLNAVSNCNWFRLCETISLPYGFANSNHTSAFGTCDHGQNTNCIGPLKPSEGTGQQVVTEEFGKGLFLLLFIFMIYVICWMYLVAGAYFLRSLFRWWAALCAVSGRPIANKKVLIKVASLAYGGRGMSTYISLSGKKQKRVSPATSSGKWRTRVSKCGFWNGHSSDYFRAVITVTGLFATGMYLGAFDMTLGYPGEGPRSEWSNKYPRLKMAT